MARQYVKVADIEKLIEFVQQTVKAKSQKTIEPKLKRDKWIALRYTKNETAMLKMRAIQNLSEYVRHKISSGTQIDTNDAQLTAELRTIDLQLRAWGTRFQNSFRPIMRETEKQNALARLLDELETLRDDVARTTSDFFVRANPAKTARTKK